MRPGDQESVRGAATPEWSGAYGEREEIARRRRAMPAKLAMLGLTAASRDARVLDMCCGHGEALDSMYALGFRDLTGVDLNLQESLRNDARFRLVGANALSTGLPGGCFDWVLCIHALHHFASSDGVDAFLREADRLLKTGGRLGIVDFPCSLPVRAAFWFFRQGRFLWTPYLKRFGVLIREEWPFLDGYLRQWPETRRLLLGGRFHVVSVRRTMFYFHIQLRKPRVDQTSNDGTQVPS
jgi:ubiquinone/menaquinone biosynthesis C-methylase UbiE